MHPAFASGRSVALCLLLAATSLARAQNAPADYARLCVGCHGAEFRLPGNGAPTARTTGQLADAISHGRPSKGMPAFGSQLSPAAIQDLAQLIEAAGATGSSRVGDTIEAESLNPCGRRAWP